MKGFYDNEPNDGHRHIRDHFDAGRCWKCGKTMRLPAMRGGPRVQPRKF